MKHRLGRLPGAGPLAVDFAREVHAQGFAFLPITLEHGQVARSLACDHRDPVDRMPVAQARSARSSPFDGAVDSFEAVLGGLDLRRD